MLQATNSNADNTQDGRVSFGRKIKHILLFSYRKVHNFQMVIIVFRTIHISYKRVSTEY